MPHTYEFPRAALTVDAIVFGLDEENDLKILLIQRVLPGMLARRSGTLINMVSESGMINPPAPAGEGGWGWAYSSSNV